MKEEYWWVITVAVGQSCRGLLLSDQLQFELQLDSLLSPCLSFSTHKHTHTHTHTQTHTHTHIYSNSICAKFDLSRTFRIVTIASVPVNYHMDVYVYLCKYLCK